jgi:chromosome segregation ATPase
MRIVKWGIRGVVATALLVGAAVALQTTGLGSYVFSGGKYVKEAMADSVPIEFELRRARDMIDELIPEMHANIRLIAKEEVEIESLEMELVAAASRTDEHRAKLASLRNALRTEQVRYLIAGRNFSRVQLQQSLSRRLEQCQNAEDILAGKERLLENRRTSLDAAHRSLAETQRAKEELTAQVATLESQFRLVQASSMGTDFELKATKLAGARRLLKTIKKRLDVAQRVLEKEQHFVDFMPAETAAEPDKDLLDQVDSYLNTSGPNDHGRRGSATLAADVD